LPTEPASTDEVATATRRYLAALATVRAAEDAATARDAAAVALADRCERAWLANVALLELALQHAARASSVEAARSVADRALAIHGRGAAKAADGA
jgi:nuclear transport factor 2 (NTF2) superfamily protein